MRRVGFVLCILAALAAGAAVADPIPNGSFDDRTVGWFDGRGLTCPEICRQQRAVAEMEKNTLPPVDVSYVCKIRKAEEGPYMWLFGSQFATRPACYTTDRDLRGEYSDIFYCLCVKPVLQRGELAPEGSSPQDVPAE